MPGKDLQRLQILSAIALQILVGGEGVPESVTCFVRVQVLSGSISVLITCMTADPDQRGGGAQACHLL